MNNPALRMAVVGGGFTGAALVIHAVRAASRPLDIVVIEPREELGRGIAYSTTDPAHRINVPSDRMGLLQDDPCGATQWLFAAGVLPDRDSHDGHGHFYVPRHAYGDYVGDALRRTVAAASDRVAFRHERCAATAVERDGSGWRVRLADGTTVAADLVALCFGHAVPHRPCRLGAGVEHNPKFVADPWAPDALGAIEPDESVLVVGTGLTMADVVMSLRSRGHAGPITAVSRRGLVSRPHGDWAETAELAEDPPPTTALGLLRLVRQEIRAAAPGVGWQAVADAVRAKLPVLWHALPPREKARVLHRLLPFWEVHRFRIAPQVHAALAADRDAGGFCLEQAGLAGLDLAGEQIVATLTRAGGRHDTVAFDAVVLCTGPEKNLRTNVLVAALLDHGLARLDDTGLGIAVDDQSRVLGPEGRAHPGLRAFGPITRGSFGEMTGAPDITKHIERLSRSLLA